MTFPIVSGLLRAVERDIIGIERLLPDLPDLAAFHAQQATEKLARAACLHAGFPDIRTHDIARIAAQLAHEHPLRSNLVKLSTLTGAATAWRYPDAEGGFPKPPDPREIQIVLEQIKRLQAEIHGLLSTPKSLPGKNR